MTPLLLLASLALAQDAPPRPAAEPVGAVVPLPADVTLGLPIIVGDSSIEAVFNGFAEHRDEIARCYAKGGSSELEGEVLVRVKLNDVGAVEDAAVSTTTLMSPAIEWCAVRVLGEASFDSPGGGTIVLPLSFYPI